MNEVPPVPVLVEHHRRENAGGMLPVQLQFEQFVHSLMLTFVLAPNTLEMIVGENLGHLAMILDVDRVSIHEFNSEAVTFERTQEWRTDEAPATHEVVHGRYFPQIVEHLRGGAIVRVTTMKGQAIIVPLYTSERLLGTLTFTNFGTHTHALQQHLSHLQLLGVILTGALEQRRVHEESQQHLHEAAHISRVVSVAGLTTSIAHEINQPLTAILSNAQAGSRLLMDAELDVEEIRSIFDDIASGVIRIGNLVRQMHGLLKKRTSELAPCRLNEIVQSVIRLTKSDTIIHQVKVTVNLAPSDTIVFGDRIQLQQVILNLIKNAIEALYLSDSQSRLITVTTALTAPDRVQLTVRDSGPGIATENTRRIFDSFFTTKPHGLGVGLSISRSLVLAHHGSLGVTNNADGGASFYLSLPLMHAEGP